MAKPKLELLALNNPNTCSQCGAETKWEDGSYIYWTSLYAENVDAANAGQGICPECAGKDTDESLRVPYGADGYHNPVIVRGFNVPAARTPAPVMIAPSSEFTSGKPTPSGEPVAPLPNTELTAVVETDDTPQVKKVGKG